VLLLNVAGRYGRVIERYESATERYGFVAERRRTLQTRYGSVAERYERCGGVTGRYRTLWNVTEPLRKISILHILN